MGRYSSLVQRLGRQRWFAALGRRLMPVDRRIQQLTRGRLSIIGRHGLPAMLLTTTGRKSGLPRTQPLLYALDGDGYVVVGSNWGQTHQPAWSGNLLAAPDAVVTIDGKAIPVHATLATGAERARLWALLETTWPAYREYEQRAGGRDLRVFRLAPRRAGPPRTVTPGPGR
jgi:deazaflavin-dependent oxidoreductase (nitroreductase family)